MITISFLSGELIQFEDLFDGATIYNIKRMICDWIDENGNGDYESNDIELVHLYDKDNNEIDDNEKITDDFYKAFINKYYETRILYIKNGIIYYHRKNESPSDNDSQICNDAIASLKETSSIKYYVDLPSFVSSWGTSSFYDELGHSLRDDNEYNNIYPSEDEWEDENVVKKMEEKQIEYRTRECLFLIFKKLKVKFLL